MLAEGVWRTKRRSAPRTRARAEVPAVLFVGRDLDHLHSLGRPVLILNGMLDLPPEFRQERFVGVRQAVK